MKIPVRVRYDVRAFVEWLGAFPPKGAVFRPCIMAQPLGSRKTYQWERTMGMRARNVTLMQVEDFYQQRTFTRAVQQGLVVATPTASARAPFHPAGFIATKRSAVRLRLTELGKAAYSLWVLGNRS